MEATVEAFRERLEQPWLVERQDDFVARFEHHIVQQQSYRCARIIQDHSPLNYLAEALACVALQAPAFLANPSWAETGREQIKAVNPENASSAYAGRIMIPTGGTGGRIKFAMHNWQSLCAAVEGYTAFFKSPVINSWCTLPLYHVSGFMQAVRSFVTGGRLVLADCRDLSAYPELDRATFHLSLVPTQLQRMLDKPDGADWLRGFGLILMGGAAMPRELLDKARQVRLPLACSYGMTETAAVVAAQRPEAFLAGEPLAGELLPHAAATIGEGSEILLFARSLFQGYYPEKPEPRKGHATADEGHLDGQGRLVVVGRLDRLINSGGEKIDPLVVETAIRGQRPGALVLVAGEPDPEWGQRVVALVNGLTEADIHALAEELKTHLSPHLLPKRWLVVDALPLKPNGKVDRAQLERLLGSS